MTGAAAALLPGTAVLLDTDDKWANRPLRGQRGVVVHRYEAAIGSEVGADVVVCIGPCGKAAHSVNCHTAVAFKADELHRVPDPALSEAEAVPPGRAGSPPGGTATDQGHYGVGVVIT